MRYEGSVSVMVKIQSKEVPSSIGKTLHKDFAVHSASSFTEAQVTKIFFCNANSNAEAIDITKKMFFDFCKENGYNAVGGMTTKVKLSTLMNPYNGHNEDLVNKINYIWATGKYDNELHTIAKALFKRDEEECFEKNIIPEQYENDLYGFLYEMFIHVCDDADLEVVIDFVRCRNSKGQIIWACSDGWEE
jgi:hypothetical protein